MKNVFKFLLFMIYATAIFFLPNGKIIFFLLPINIVTMILAKTSIKGSISSIFQFLPFILLTVIINCILDNIEYALWVGLKLVIVCNITYVYAKTTTIMGIAKTIGMLCKPLEILKINIEEIEVMVCISLSMLFILKKEIREVKDACKAKNIDMNLKNMKVILSKFFLSLIKRVNEIEEALIEKGYEY